MTKANWETWDVVKEPPKMKQQKCLLLKEKKSWLHVHWVR